MRLIMRLLVVATLLLSASPALAKPGSDVRGPACADVVDGEAFWTRTGTEAEVGARILLADRSCRGVTYTLLVFSNGELIKPVASESQTGDGSSQFVTFGPLPMGELPGVCLVVTTSAGHHLFDRAPNDECVIATDFPPFGQHFA
jgi:hypothetical protein